MLQSQISNLRLQNQQILSTKFASAKELVNYMGAMQAQDYAWAKWAIGVRLPGSTDDSIELAINKGEIIRTHILRPTWHFVSPENIRWMLELTANNIKRYVATYYRQLELDDKIFSKANKLIEKMLRGNQLTREEIMNKLEDASIKTNDLRANHIMFNAEIDGLVCNGKRRGKKFTYALLDEVVPPSRSFSNDEALAKLTLIYFTSHGPATIKDFIWWSGLPSSEVRRGLENSKSSLQSEKVDGKEYWFIPVQIENNIKDSSIYFLPAYDEFMVSYTDRSASLDNKYLNTTISGNGIFKPIIVKKGNVIGTWKRTLKKDEVLIEINLFDSTKSKKGFKKYIRPFEQFLKIKSEIVNKP